MARILRRRRQAPPTKLLRRLRLPQCSRRRRSCSRAGDPRGWARRRRHSTGTDRRLLRRVTGIVARSVDGPVIVVSAPGQALPALDGAVEIVTDEREGRGPLQGLAAGLAAVGDRAPVAYVSSTDVPLLHPAFVSAVLKALGDDVDVVLPEVGGYRQPLSAAYRVDLLDTVNDLIAADRMRPAFLFERSRVLHLTEPDLLKNGALNRLDPDLRSVSNLNEPADYERAHALPAPEIVGRAVRAAGQSRVRAAPPDGPSVVARRGRRRHRPRAGRARGGRAQRRQDHPRPARAVGQRGHACVHGRGRGWLALLTCHPAVISGRRCSWT